MSVDIQLLLICSRHKENTYILGKVFIGNISLLDAKRRNGMAHELGQSGKAGRPNAATTNKSTHSCGKGDL